MACRLRALDNDRRKVPAKASIRLIRNLSLRELSASRDIGSENTATMRTVDGSGKKFFGPSKYDSIKSSLLDKTSTRLADGNLTREAGGANALGERI